MIHIKDTRKIQLNNGMRTAVALGKFDGLHEGHMLLIRRVLELQGLGYTGVLFTFDMKENSVFDVDGMRTIYTSEEKCRVAADTGIDMMIEYPFDDRFAGMEPEAFIRDVLAGMLGAAYIVVGADFRFGRDRLGDVDTLKEYATQYGYEVCAVEKLEIAGTTSGGAGIKPDKEPQTVSSTTIRGLIAQGDMESVIPLLGRPYSMTGTVECGKQLGRTIGIPTANILPKSHKLYPPAGVYASRIRIEKQKHDALSDPYRVYYGITNIGDNPTVNDGGGVTIETNIFDFDDDIYGDIIRVELLRRVRGERRFDGVDELAAQMNRDIKAVKEKLPK